MSIAIRKNNHLDICLTENVRSEITNGFEKYRLIHNALPESDFEDFSIESIFLNKVISAPIMISSMTGGTEEGERINHNLLKAASELNIPFAIGSQRVYLTEKKNLILPYRKIAEKIPLLANVGAVQMNYGFDKDILLRAVEMIEADALILHLNPLQELIQQNGNTNFSGLLKKIESLCANFPVPVIVKEVGFGISCDAARKLIDAGVTMIDVAGAGGTSWSQVESLIDGSDEIKLLCDPFKSWGIPTAECIQKIHEMDPSIVIIASGGITNGIEAAKAVFLGAQLSGLAARILPAAAYGNSDTVYKELQRIILQYKISMFLSSGIEKCEQGDL